MTTIFHYGKYVDSETPITGVISNNNIEWSFVDNEICIDCEEMLAQNSDCCCPECGSYNFSYGDEREDYNYKCDDCGEEFEWQDESDFIECDSSHTKLFGDWIEVTGPTLEKEKDLCWFIVNGTGYYPDKNGEFSAIERESETQIVFSKYTKRTALCSPCYPGQGDLNSSGEYLAYDLPKELKYSYDEDKE